MHPRFYSFISLCALLALIPHAQSADSTPPLGVVSNTGFCPNGVWDHTRWPEGDRPEGLTVWGSYCARSDADTGRIELQPFLAPSTLNLYLAGYPGEPGRRLLLKNLQSGQEIELKPHSLPRENWRLDTLPVPPDWIGKPVQLIADDTNTGGSGWLGFSIPLLPESALALPAIDKTLPESGFCPDGVYPGTKWPVGLAPPGIKTWGSYCKSGDAGTGWTASQPVVAGSYLSFYVAGYPTTPGLRLAVENVQSGRQLLLQVATSPMETWQLFHFRLPDSWKGQNVRIVAGDQATGSFGWLAFSEPVSTGTGTALSAAKTLGLLLVLGTLLLLPSLAACMLAASRGVKDQLDLNAIAFLALGLTGYAAFWIYFCSPAAGMVFCYAGLLACCAVIAYFSAVKSRRSKLTALKQLIAPWTLIALASIFILSLGLLHGGEAKPLLTAANRFSPIILAADNEIPKVFADAIYSGHVPTPLISDWLSSDRPPLQSGNTLWTYIGLPGNPDLKYLVLSVVLQCSFLAALWSFLLVCKIARKPFALAIAACFFSGFTYLNAFYTWPKLYPVAFLLIVVAYLFTDRYEQVRDNTIIGAMLGAITTLALLCHGGSMFFLPGLAAGMLLLRRYPSRRFLVSLAGALVLLYLPWTLYQKFFDPPGDRLMKWHIAGAEAPQPQASFTGLLFTNYGKLTAGQLFDLKGGNFKTLAGDLPEFLGDVGSFTRTLAAGSASRSSATAALLRRNMLVNWIPSLGLFILGPLALLLPLFKRRPRTPEFIAASRMWLLTGLTLLLWPLILFGPVATLPHQGTYVTEILAFAGSSLAFWIVSPWLCLGITTVQILWSAAVFIWMTPVAPQIGAGVVAGPANVFLGASCILSAAAMAGLLAAFARRTDPSPAIIAEAPPVQKLAQKPMANKVSRPTVAPSWSFARPSLQDTLLMLLGLVITVYILVTTLVVIRNCYFPIPVSDQWDEWRLFFASKSYSPFFFDQHNEHRIALARIFFYIDQFVFHGRSAFLLVSIFLTQVITGVCLWRSTLSSAKFSRTSSVLLACFVFSCLFSGQQFNNFTWGFQIQFVAVYCTAIGAVFALARTRTSPRPEIWLAASCFLAVLSTYSMSNGLVVWPLLLGMSFWLGSPRRHRIILAVGMVLLGIAYLWGYHSPGHHANPYDSLFFHLPQVLTFAAAFLGSPADPPARVILRHLGIATDAARVTCCALFGLAGVATFFAGFYTVRRKRWTLNPVQIALVCILLFIMLTSFLVGLGRVNFPLMDALVSRYATPAMIFWSSLVLLGWSLFLVGRMPSSASDSQVAGKRLLKAYIGLLLFMLGAVAVEQPEWINFSKSYASSVAEFQAAAVSGVEDTTVLRSGYHSPSTLFDIFDYMKANRLSVFTEDWTHWQDTPLSAHFTVDAPTSCVGSFDAVTFLPSALRPGSRAGGWAWDKKDDIAPQMIILADRAGRIVGVAHNIVERADVAAVVPAVKSTMVGWHGYVVPTDAGPVTAYLLESDGKSVCPFGALPTGQHFQEAAVDDLSSPIAAPVAIEGAWSKDGYPGESEKPSFDGPVYASWSGSDANTGTLHLGPFSVANQLAIAVPVITGPTNQGLFIKVVNAKTGDLIAALSPPPVRLKWWVWRIDLPTAPDLQVTLEAQDMGRAWGQWEGVGMPHLLKHSTLNPLAAVNNSAQQISPEAVGAAVDNGPPTIDGFWAKDGYNPEAGRPPVDGPAYGSWAGSDAHTGTLRLGPFTVHGQHTLAIPLVTGPSNTGMEIKLVDAASGEILALLSPPPTRMKWWLWKVSLPPDRPEMKLEVLAKDNGAAWGQWQAIGTPHVVK